MATQENSTPATARDRLTESSLEGCYLETLLKVIEDHFEEIDAFCEYLPEAARDRIRYRARHGLNVTYMAQDKVGAVKKLTDDVERELWLAERRKRNELAQ